jgi:hypothetical protein
MSAFPPECQHGRPLLNHSRKVSPGSTWLHAKRDFRKNAGHFLATAFIEVRKFTSARCLRKLFSPSSLRCAGIQVPLNGNPSSSSALLGRRLVLALSVLNLDELLRSMAKRESRQTARTNRLLPLEIQGDSIGNPNSSRRTYAVLLPGRQPRHVELWLSARIGNEWKSYSKCSRLVNIRPGKFARSLGYNQVFPAKSRVPERRAGDCGYYPAVIRLYPSGLAVNPNGSPDFNCISLGYQTSGNFPSGEGTARRSTVRRTIGHILRTAALRKTCSDYEGVYALPSIR